jgi:hypothetical protein
MGQITFSRKNTACHMLIFVDGKQVGYIHACYGRQVRCPECGNLETDYTKATSYGLSIVGRCWRKGQLVPPGQGGYSEFGARRLKDVKAKAVEVLS